MTKAYDWGVEVVDYTDPDSECRLLLALQIQPNDPAWVDVTRQGRFEELGFEPYTFATRDEARVHCKRVREAKVFGEKEVSIRPVKIVWSDGP